MVAGAFKLMPAKHFKNYEFSTKSLPVNPLSNNASGPYHDTLHPRVKNTSPYQLTGIQDRRTL